MVISHDLIIKFYLFKCLFFFHGLCHLITGFNFNQEFGCLFLSDASSFFVCFLHGQSLLFHEQLLFVFEFLLFYSNLISLGDLVDYNLCTVFSGGCPPFFSFLLLLKLLEPLDLHHEIKFFLLFYILLLELLILLKLLVPNCNDFGVHHFLIHVFDIVLLFIKLLLSSGEEALRPLFLLQS